MSRVPVPDEVLPDKDTILGQGIWENYTVRDGLPDMKIECVAEDSRGDIWVGTHDGGVARFDGVEFTCYDQSDGLAGNGVYSIIEDREGCLWFGTDRGLSRRHCTGFETVRADVDCSVLWGRSMDPSGELWFGVNRRPGKPASVCHWDGQSARIRHVRGVSTDYGESINMVDCEEEGLRWFGGDCLYLVDDEEGRIVYEDIRAPWALLRHRGGYLVGHEDGLSWLNSDWTASTFHRLPSPGASAIARIAGDQVVVADHWGRFYSMGPAGLTLTKDFGRPVQTMLYDSGGRLWVGTYGRGLYRSDYSKWTAFSGAEEQVANSVALTASGQVVAGARSGLWVGTAESGFVAVKTPFPMSDEVTSVCQDSSGGICFGMRTGQVGRLSPDGSFDCFVRPDGSATSRAAELTLDPRTKRIWYASSPGKGLGCYEASGRGRHFGPRNPHGYPQWIGAIGYWSERESILVGTNAGGADNGIHEILQDGSIHVVSMLGNRSIQAIAAVGDCVYVGTSRGATVVRHGVAHELSLGGDASCKIVTALAADSDRTLWIGTEGGGVFRYDGGNLVRLMLPGGPELSTIHAILPVCRGHAWLVTAGGMLQYSSNCKIPSVSVAIGRTTVQATKAPSAKSARARVELFFSSKSKVLGPDSVQYQFRVHGSGPEWTVADGNRASVDLPIGRHTIEARAITADLSISAIDDTEVSVEDDSSALLLQEALAVGNTSGGFVGESPEVEQLRGLILRLGSSDLSLLLLGETGTGKSLAARLLHSVSPRSQGPFVQVNCGAISDSLAESELFGHERGAFTGAVQKRLGKFALANGGTILLDEVGDLPLGVQAKLLHVLQDGVFEPLGSQGSVQSDARVVAATNRDLEEAVRLGAFREDLYYRLSASVLRVPPLRERGDDIQVLACHFCSRFSSHLEKQEPSFSPEALALLRAHRWPGNVRELENVIQRAVTLCEGPAISGKDLCLAAGTAREGWSLETVSLAEHERRYLSRVLDISGGRIEGAEGAAEILGLRPSTLRSRLRKHGLR